MAERVHKAGAFGSPSATATLRDVAGAAGVSIATVSRVLTGARLQDLAEDDLIDPLGGHVGTTQRLRHGQRSQLRRR